MADAGVEVEGVLVAIILRSFCTTRVRRLHDFEIEPQVPLSRVSITFSRLVARCSACCHTTLEPLYYGQMRIDDPLMA